MLPFIKESVREKYYVIITFALYEFDFNSLLFTLIHLQKWLYPK